MRYVDKFLLAFMSLFICSSGHLHTYWIPTFPACCGQAFLPGGASRTVHSSLLLSGECWWASICKWQPGEGKPPNTPLFPLCSQGKGLYVWIQGSRCIFVLFVFVSSLSHPFIPLCIQHKKDQMFIWTPCDNSWRMLDLWKSTSTFHTQRRMPEIQMQVWFFCNFRAQ